MPVQLSDQTLDHLQDSGRSLTQRAADCSRYGQKKTHYRIPDTPSAAANQLSSQVFGRAKPITSPNIAVQGMPDDSLQALQAIDKLDEGSYIGDEAGRYHAIRSARALIARLETPWEWHARTSWIEVRQSFLEACRSCIHDFPCLRRMSSAG